MRTLPSYLAPRTTGVVHVGKNESVHFASEYVKTDEFRNGAKNPRGPEWWWTNPLVIRLNARSAIVGADVTSIAAVIDEIDYLDGFRAGWWPEVRHATIAAVHAIRQAAKADADMDQYLHAAAAEYDARVEERTAFHADDPSEEQHVNAERLRVRALDSRQGGRSLGKGLLWLAALATAAKLLGTIYFRSRR